MMLNRKYFPKGKYFRKKVIRIIRKAIFDPLTTSICDVPAAMNASLVSRERRSIDPIVIPRSVPATSLGK